MAFFSLLPEHLTIYEVWLTRFFLLLGILTLLPWALLIIYDFVVYIIRVSTYDLPVIGGRARGEARPRAPSLSERPSGRPRTFSLGASPSPSPSGRAPDKRDSLRSRTRRGSSNVLIDAE